MIDGAVVISRPFGYAPPYIELTLAVACYLPAAEADTGKARRSYLLLSLIWFFVVTAAADQVRYWGGMGRVSFLDVALAGAMFAPVALTSPSRKGLDFERQSCHNQ